MEKEKNQKNDVIENETLQAPPVFSSENLGFEVADAFDWREANEAVETNGQETVFSNTGLKLQREIRDGDNGKKYQNFAIAFFVELNGKKIRQSAYFMPPAKNGGMYELLDAIFGDEKYFPADIVRNTRSVTDGSKTTTNVTYSLRVSAKSDVGGVMSCDMSPANRGDRLVFSNLIELLKARKVIE